MDCSKEVIDNYLKSLPAGTQIDRETAECMLYLFCFFQSQGYSVSFQIIWEIIHGLAAKQFTSALICIHCMQLNCPKMNKAELAKFQIPKTIENNPKTIIGRFSKMKRLNMIKNLNAYHLCLLGKNMNCYPRQGLQHSNNCAIVSGFVPKVEYHQSCTYVFTLIQVYTIYTIHIY